MLSGNTETYLCWTVDVAVKDNLLGIIHMNFKETISFEMKDTSKKINLSYMRCILLLMNYVNCLRTLSTAENRNFLRRHRK